MALEEEEVRKFTIDPNNSSHFVSKEKRREWIERKVIRALNIIFYYYIINTIFIIYNVSCQNSGYRPTIREYWKSDGIIAKILSAKRIFRV